MNEPIFDEKIFTEAELVSLRTQAFDYITRPECLHRSQPPKAVIVSGPIGSGKTRYIRANYSRGYIYLDAGELFRIYEQGLHLEFPGPLFEELSATGYEVAQYIFNERLDLVVEFVGTDINCMQRVLDAFIALGYVIEYEFIYQDLGTAIEWNFSRGSENISAYHCEIFHEVWITEAAKEESRRMDISE